MPHAPGTIPIDTMAVTCAVKLRFPTVQNFKLSQQGTKVPAWYVTYQLGGKLSALTFPGNLDQQQLIAQIDAALIKAGASHQLHLPLEGQQS